MADVEVDIPIIGGVDQDTDARITAKLVAGVNCTYEKDRSLSQRNGFDCIGPYNKRLDTTTPGTCEFLTTFRDELVRIGSGRIDTFGVVGTTSDWIGKGAVSPCTASRFDVSGGESSVDHDVVTVGTTAVFVSSQFPLTYSTTSIVLDVYDTVTGAFALGSYVVASGTSGGSNQVWNPKVVALSSTLVAITWLEDGVTETLKGRVLNTTTMTLGSTQTIASSLGAFGRVTPYDVCVIGGNLYAAVLASSGANRIKVVKTDSALAVVGSYTNTSSTDTAIGSFGIFGDTTTIHCAWSTIVGAGPYDWYVKSVGITPALATAYASATISSEVGFPNAGAPGGVSGCVLSSTQAVVTWWVDYGGDIDSNASPTRSPRASYWQEITRSSGAYVYTSGVPRTLDQFCFMSRPTYLSAYGYVVIYGTNIHSTHSTGFLVKLPVLDGNSYTTTAGIAATVLPRECFNAYARDYSSLSTLAADSSGIYRCAAAFDAGPYQLQSNIGGTVLSFDFTRPVVSACESGDLLLLGGGVPSAYDGDRAFELGFPYEPDVCVSLTRVVGGGTLSAGTYRYVLIYSWIDSSGNIHQSGPSPLSPAMTKTGISANDRITLTIRALRLTNRVAGDATVNNIKVDIYRTEADGAAYYYVGSVSNNTYGDATSYLSYTDGMADVDARENPQPYTLGISGEELPNRILPSCRYVAAFKAAIAFAGSDDDTIWLSKPQVPGYAPGFNGQLSVDPFEGGRVTALVALDDLLYPLKQNSIYQLSGDPPLANGVSSMSLPTPVPTQVGCIDARSVAVIPQGATFQTKDILYLLTRNAVVTPIGKNVQTYVSGSTSVCAATLVGAKHTMRIALDSSSRVMCMDLRREVEGDAVWSEAQYTDAQTGTWVAGVNTVAPSAASIKAATCWRGNYVWISSNGYLYQENAYRVDRDYAGNIVPVPVTVTLGAVKIGKMQGYTRSRRVSVLFEATGAVPINVRMAVDYSSSFTSRTWNATEVAAMTKQQVQMHPHPQKCQAFQIKVDTTGQPYESAALTDNFRLTSVQATVDVNRGQNRIKPSQIR